MEVFDVVVIVLEHDLRATADVGDVYFGPRLFLFHEFFPCRRALAGAVPGKEASVPYFRFGLDVDQDRFHSIVVEFAQHPFVADPSYAVQDGHINVFIHDPASHRA